MNTLNEGFHLCVSKSLQQTSTSCTDYSPMETKFESPLLLYGSYKQMNTSAALCSCSSDFFLKNHLLCLAQIEHSQYGRSEEAYTKNSLQLQ